MKHSETKNIVLLNQRQNIKVKDGKENKTRIKISDFYKWYSSNTVDIKLARYFFLVYSFFLDFRSGSFSYISAKRAVKNLYRNNGLLRWEIFIDSPMIILGLFLILWSSCLIFEGRSGGSGPSFTDFVSLIKCDYFKKPFSLRLSQSY